MNNSSKDSIPPELLLQINQMKAKQMQVEKQQGLGRAIISTEFKGYRCVFVGNRTYYSKNWKTFHDFLFEYLRTLLGKEWGQAELAKPFDDRHPIIQWHSIAHQFMRDNQQGNGKINTSPMTGAISAYMNLAYNLYLLAHNVEIQDRLIKRLKDLSQFRGALYETYVAAEFIKAGFKLEIENEEDSRTTHCEFTAIAKESGKKYSIEAKARQPHKDNVSIGNQMYEALKKEAKHNRIIFIDVNIQNFLDHHQSIVDEMKRKEGELKINGQPADPAYIFITNHPFEYDLENICENRSGLSHGFKIPEFGFNFAFTSIRDVLKAREKHGDMFHLVKSICEHEEIPSTFDGENPEFAFPEKDDPTRLVIGGKYKIPGPNGDAVECVLQTATVLEPEKMISGIYRTEDGKQLIYHNPMSDRELMAYRRQPDTFFGVPLRQGKKSKDPIDLFDFFIESYKNCPREKLLGFLKDDPNYAELEKLDQKELLIECCERWTYSAITIPEKGEEREGDRPPD